MPIDLKKFNIFAKICTRRIMIMAFCKFTTDFIAHSFTLVDNAFFTRYLPSTPPKLATIYLYGLYLCSNQIENEDNLNIDTFSASLGYSVKDVRDAFLYWEEQGIIRMIDSDPLQIQYLPIGQRSANTKKYSKDKYSAFNTDVQKLLAGRMLTPSEFEEYYGLMEGYGLPDGRKLPPESLLMVIKYCVDYKGDNVGYRYIITVAQNWAKEGHITPEQIEQKIQSYSLATQNVQKILKALGSTKKPALEEYDLYNKWLEKMEFDNDTIIYVAKSIKKSSTNATFDRLDKKLQKYYEMKLFDETSIQKYEKHKDAMYTLARSINKTLGLFYDDVGNQVETYIAPWLAMGFEPATLMQIAQSNYKKSKRTLQMLDDSIHELYNQGIITSTAYIDYNNRQSQVKDMLGDILQKLSINRNVTSLDIEFYERWTNVWGFGDDVINYAVELTKNRGANLSYTNSILADWHSQNAHTLDKAKELSKIIKETTTKKVNDAVLKKREYTQAEKDSIFDNIKEIEL